MVKVTIYIINRNNSKFLSDCISSAINQKFRNFEVIIIDDNSSDNSVEIINSYKKIKKIRVFLRRKNYGLIGNLNYAIKKAKGQFILRLDSDDVLHKYALKKLYAKIKEDKRVALVFPDYFLINKDSKIIKKYTYKHKFKYTIKDPPAHGACSLINKNILKNIGGYNKKFDRQDGHYIWLSILYNNFSIKHLRLSLFYYRKHQTNMTRDRLKILNARLKILNFFLNKMNDKQVLLSKKKQTLTKIKKLNEKNTHI